MTDLSTRLLAKIVDVEHAARGDDFDPWAVDALALCQAHREIVELHAGEHECPEMHSGTYPKDWPPDARRGAPGQAWRHASNEHFEVEPCPTLRAVARGYGLKEEEI